ncbi:prohead core scaffold and protease [Campylobacter phage PC5]|uniref:Prohead core scaffold and protease n=1 Tax=Campylobacter phage PC5 TaxID=1541690 RepID=A0A1B0XVR8_9CAUD|nr:prohead core scaffold and protease [Campylobacter phage PC5]WJZ70265.1 putative prohead core scaffolding protein and protease [Campylobacter phage F341]
MKLIIEEPVKIKGSVELNESKGEKNYYIQGIFATINQQNINGRVYPRPIWESAVNSYQHHITTPTTSSLMEYQHPNRQYVDPLEAVAKIVDLRIEGDYVMGKAKLLDNPKANQLKNLIDEGISIGVSSRGCGELMNGTVTEYELITFDIVPNPSDRNAHTKGLNESFDNGILKDKNYIKDKNGILVEADESNINNKSITSQFVDLFSQL